MSERPEHWKYAAEQMPLVNARQREVLDLIERGHTNQEIADRLEITLAGAKWHVSELLGRLGLNSREEMAEFWAWQRSRRRGFGILTAFPSVSLPRWLAPVGASAIAVAIAVPWLLLRGGAVEPEPASSTAVADVSPAPTPAASLAPSRSLATYTIPLPTAGPDGRLAYIDPAGNLVVMPMPSGAPAVVRTAAGQRHPRWSASGEYLAVVEAGVLLVLDGQGRGTPLASLDRDGSWGWSPTEDVLALLTSDGFVLYNAVAGATMTLRDQGAPLPEQPGSLIWSPDGTRILYQFFGRFFTVGGANTSEMRVVDVRTGEDRLLIEQETPPLAGTMPQAWSADGQWVFYREAPAFGASIWVDGVPLYVMPSTGGPPVRLGTSLGRADLFSADAGSPLSAFVEGGNRFATEALRRIALVAGNELTELEDAAPGTHTAVTWAPSGARLAYIAMPEPPPPPRNVSGGQGALALLMRQKLWVQAMGGPAQQLTNDPEYRDEHPVWSIDGESILFARIDAQGRASIWRVEADGGQPQQLVDTLGLGQQGPLGIYGWVQWGDLMDWWQPE